MPNACIYFKFYCKIIKSFTHSLTYSLTHSLIHSLIHSFIHSFIHLLTESLTVPADLLAPPGPRCSELVEEKTSAADKDVSISNGHVGRILALTVWLTGLVVPLDGPGPKNG